MRGPGDTIIVNPDYVHGVGAQVMTDAQNLLSGPSGAQDFHTTLTQINGDKFPVQLYSAFYQFIEAHTNELTMLCTDRHNLGHALQDVKVAAEQTEINNMAGFNAVPNSAIGGPQTFQ